MKSLKFICKISVRSIRFEHPNWSSFHCLRSGLRSVENFANNQHGNVGGIYLRIRVAVWQQNAIDFVIFIQFDYCSGFDFIAANFVRIEVAAFDLGKKIGIINKHN